MESLVGYGSEDEGDERYGNQHHSGGGGYSGHGGSRRREDDTNYDDVNMDMSEDSQGGESEPELPQAEPAPPRHSYRDDHKHTESRERDDRRRRESPPAPGAPGAEVAPRHRHDKERARRETKRDDRHRSEKDRTRGGGHRDGIRRGLLGDRPDDVESKPPALMDLKPFGGEVPPSLERKSHDARDAVSPRFSERDRRERDREREREREHRTNRHSEEKRSGHKADRRERSRSRGAPNTSSHSSSSSSTDRRSPPDYRPSYKVNKKLEVMEKMGLQIKTPDGSMATAQQLRAAASEPAAPARPYFNHGSMGSHRILDQVQKRKLLWSNKAKNETEEAAKWSGTRFAQDNDGKQVSKFMRLMGIKEPAAVKPEPAAETADPIKKQEELFQAMQAQYEVARATTHTMRGVGLGFQRGQY